MSWKAELYSNAMVSDRVVYSRAVVGDLCPDPVSPLTTTAGVGAELNRAWCDVCADIGLLPARSAHAEAARRAVVTFGGYLYLNTSLLRLLGTHGAGAEPPVSGVRYPGERSGVSPGSDENQPVPADTTLLSAWVTEALRRGDQSPPAADLGRRARRLRGERPALDSQSQSALVARIESVRAELTGPLRLLVHAEIATAVAAEILSRTSEDAGNHGVTGDLVAGTGPSISPPAEQLWAHADRVRRSSTLTRLFDLGVARAANVLDTAPGGDIGGFSTSLRRLRTEHGHIGPAEWELSAPTWATDMRLLLGLIDALRRGATRWADVGSGARACSVARRTDRSVEAVRRTLRATPIALERFESALTATRHWLTAREHIRGVVSMLHHEQRLAARELARPHVESGLLDVPEQVFMLRRTELETFTTAPERLAETLRLRAYDYHALATYRPPVSTTGRPSPIVHWPRARVPERATAASCAQALRGTPASVGTATGPARVVRTAAAPTAVRGGDILVVTSGSPAWTPLLPLVAAVVTDCATPLSQLAVSCRDLGIPCVVATATATTSISSGAAITVNGSTGAVSVRPAAPLPETS